MTDYTTIYKPGDIIIASYYKNDIPQLMRIDAVYSNLIMASPLDTNFPKSVDDDSIKEPTEEHKAIALAYDIAFRNLKATNDAFRSPKIEKE